MCIQREMGNNESVDYEVSQSKRADMGKKRSNIQGAPSLLSVNRVLPVPAVLPDRLELPLQLHCLAARAPHFPV